MSEPRPAGAQFLPLRGLAIMATVLLAAVIAAIAVRVAIQQLSLGNPHWRTDFIDFRLDKAVDFMIFAAGVVLVVWFRRARINAESHGWRQRRARGWAFWGWIVPIANLWIPFQLMGDIWRAGQPEQQRQRTAWRPALWWASWLLAALGQRHPWPYLSAATGPASLGLLAVAGATLIAIIRIVSAGPVGSPPPRCLSSPRRRRRAERTVCYSVYGTT